ncbi:hypothetical protein ACF0H5_016888 [Mactra antiquata]
MQVTSTHNHVTHESQSTPSIDPSQPSVMESQSTESTTLYGAHDGSIENCADKCMVFCENIFGISDAKSKIKRAHRIGRIVPGKVRPIVAKLDSQSKLMIKNALKIINLKNTVYKMADQYPSLVLERRKELIPVMLDACRQGKKAVLVRDKLFINNQLYTAQRGCSEKCASLSILSWNVGGLKSCIDDEEFTNLVQNFDILFFSETWQNTDQPFNIHGYNSVCT